MPFFKVGDTVTIRDDLDISEVYKSDGEAVASCRVVNAMRVHAGEKHQIVAVYNGPKAWRYQLSECGGWSWTDEMFVEYLDRYDLLDDEMEPGAPSEEEILALLGI